MKASHYIKEVKKSKAFKEFLAERSDAYLCSLFFIRDFNGPQNETQVDFYSPAKKEITSFKIGGSRGVERVPLPKKALTITHKKFVPGILNDNVKMDMDALKPALTDEMHNRDMTYEIEKILAVLNVTDSRAVWNCTGFLKGLGLLQAHVEDESQSVLFMEKHSLMDMIRFPGGGMPGMGAAPPGIGVGGLGQGPATDVGPELGGGQGGGAIKVISPAELAAAIKKEKEAAKAAEKEEKQVTKKAEKAEKQTKKNSTEKKKEAKK